MKTTDFQSMDWPQSRQLTVFTLISFALWIVAPAHTLCLERRPDSDWHYVVLWLVHNPWQTLASAAVLLCLGLNAAFIYRKIKKDATNGYIASH